MFITNLKESTLFQAQYLHILPYSTLPMPLVSPLRYRLASHNVINISIYKLAFIRAVVYYPRQRFMSRALCANQPGCQPVSQAVK